MRRHVKLIAQHIHTRRFHHDFRRLPAPQLKEHLLASLQPKHRSLLRLETLIHQIHLTSGIQSDIVLPYSQEPISTSLSDSVLLLTNVVTNPAGSLDARVDVASAFVIAASNYILTCHHVFDMIAPVLPPSSKGIATCVALSSKGHIYPITGAVAASPALDLVLLNIGPELNGAVSDLVPLPTTPYPVPVDTQLEAHTADEWHFEKCQLKLYRNSIGGESRTGTYDELHSMLVDVVVPSGSSGAPLIHDGRVCGVLRGNVPVSSPLFPKGYSFATPCERVYELFKFPIVTGGGTGIGRVIAHELASLGAIVVIASRKKENLDHVAAEIQITYGTGRCDPQIVNIRDEASVKSLVDRVMAKYQRIDGLVNNAGGQYTVPAGNLTNGGMRAVVELNLMGMWMLTKACYDAYMKDNGGAIVNVIANVRNGYPSMAHTAAARSAIIGLTKTLCLEWGPTCGIRINNVVPERVIGNGMANYPPEVAKTAVQVMGTVPAGRAQTEAEVGSSVVWLLSHGASEAEMDGRPLYFKESHIPVYNGFDEKFGIEDLKVPESFKQLLRDYRKIGRKSKL
ncbi:hypothetical protein SmJEL517_g04165 [Synchytrium microbalum]|uniref:Peroxisomal trans-2-enoyl-CoA reductase n=1 Tax=Synchytrium microbalum TaxID=1806994 RepID=A0A507BVA5_9FUNG|nr:uncharacterized protein SmJEL517_g04165 [Synchytrium microbalum]TPX32827.1 hypothetical protein SmJEL517_g04165 [Synchytrium microbalum]